MTHVTSVGVGADSADSWLEGRRGRGSLSKRGSCTLPLRCDNPCRNPGQTGTHQRGQQAAGRSLKLRIFSFNKSVFGIWHHERSSFISLTYIPRSLQPEPEEWGWSWTHFRRNRFCPLCPSAPPAEPASWIHNKRPSPGPRYLSEDSWQSLKRMINIT